MLYAYDTVDSKIKSYIYATKPMINYLPRFRLELDLAELAVSKDELFWHNN